MIPLVNSNIMMIDYMQSNISNTRLYLLFAFIIIIWGLSWPISKIGVHYISPIWFTTARLVVGTLSMFLLLLASNKLTLPSRKDLPLILWLGLLQIGLFLILVNVGLYYTGVGRAAIIVYSTPLWVTPAAIFIFGEQMRPLKLIGLLLGILGIFMLFSPWSFNWHDKQVVLGNGLLIGASMCWAIAILISRYSTWHSSALSLIPWQLLVGTIPALLAAFIFEPHPHIEWHFSLIGILFYIGVLVTALGYWGTMLITRSLPIMTTSLCFLGAPVIGLLSSACFLGEPLTLDLIIAMSLIILGLIAVAISNVRKIEKIL